MTITLAQVEAARDAFLKLVADMPLPRNRTDAQQLEIDLADRTAVRLEHAYREQERLAAWARLEKQREEDGRMYPFLGRSAQ